MRWRLGLAIRETTPLPSDPPLSLCSALAGRPRDLLPAYGDDKGGIGKGNDSLSILHRNPLLDQNPSPSFLRRTCIGHPLLYHGIETENKRRCLVDTMGPSLLRTVGIDCGLYRP